MIEWVYRIADRVDRMAHADPEYQALAQQRNTLDGAFSALVEKLGEDDRELLLEYMDVVGNMQYRMTQLAWLYGKLHPHN